MLLGEQATGKSSMLVALYGALINRRAGDLRIVRTVDDVEFLSRGLLAFAARRACAGRRSTATRPYSSTWRRGIKLSASIFRIARGSCSSTCSMRASGIRTSSHRSDPRQGRCCSSALTCSPGPESRCPACRCRLGRGRAGGHGRGGHGRARLEPCADAGRCARRRPVAIVVGSTLAAAPFGNHHLSVGLRDSAVAKASPSDWLARM